MHMLLWQKNASASHGAGNAHSKLKILQCFLWISHWLNNNDLKCHKSLTDCEETHFGLQSDLMPPKPSALHEFSSSSSNTCRVVETWISIGSGFHSHMQLTPIKSSFGMERSKIIMDRKRLSLHNYRSDSTEKSTDLVLRQFGQPELWTIFTLDWTTYIILLDIKYLFFNNDWESCDTQGDI